MFQLCTDVTALGTDAYGGRTVAQFAQESNAADDSHRGAEQGMCGTFIPPRVCRQVSEVRRGRRAGWGQGVDRQQGAVLDYRERDGLEGGWFEVSMKA